MPGAQSAETAVNFTVFTVLQRKGMWEFYLGGILLSFAGAVANCLDVHSSCRVWRSGR